MKNKFLFLLFSVFAFAQLATAQVSITISNSANNPICSVSGFTLSSVAVNPGTAPTYQWYRNNTILPGAVGPTLAVSPGSTTGTTFYCILTNTTDPFTPNFDTSNVITITITNAVIPGCQITTATPIVCAGANVQFIAAISNGGSNPSFQWQVNGVTVGGNSNVYSTTNFQNGDVVICTLTSSRPCVTTPTAYSDPDTMIVNSSVVPVVSITSPNAVGCSSAGVIFSASAVNGGSNPFYQWQVNGVNTGGNSPNFAPIVNNGDVVRAIITSNAPCAIPPKDTSNDITVNILSPVTPTVSITGGPNPTCGANTITFNATPTDGGVAPSYQWYVNAIPVGTNNATYAAAFFTQGDYVTVTMTSSIPCKTVDTAVSNGIILNILAPVTPTISITGPPGNSVCLGATATYTANITNGGIAPTYQWKINGIPVPGATNSTFSSSTIPSGSLISCIFTSTEPCVTGSSAASNNLPLIVKPLLSPTVTIFGNKNNLCFGDSVMCNSNVTVGGTAPIYEWRIDGVISGSNLPNFTAKNMSVGVHTITCIMTSNSNQCLSSNKDTSNTFVVTVDPLLTPAVGISSTANNVCFGTPITINSAVVNGGPTVNYQWLLNGNPVAGTLDSSITSSNLNNGDIITVVITSSEACASPKKDTSNTFIAQIIPLSYPSIAIQSDTDFVCDFDPITYSAINIVEPGTSPTFQWMVNGVNVGTNSTTYGPMFYADGDEVVLQMTSNKICATPAIVTSAIDTVHIYPPATPDVSIFSNDTMTCIGTNIIFNTINVDQGTSPSYTWYWNGLVHGTSANSYNNTLLETGDSIFCVMTSNAFCLTKPNDTSNAIYMTVDDYITPEITLTQSISAGAPGTPITYTATTTVLPPYTIQWYRNNTLVSTTTTNTWSTNIAQTYDSVYAKIVGFTGCYLANFANSRVVKLGALSVGTWTPANFTVYPNPVQNALHVQGVENGDEVLLFDVTGKLLNKQTVAQANNFSVDMSQYSNGIYQLKFRRDNATWVVRVTKD